MLSTLLAPSSGSATVAGADLASEPQTVRRRIGYVPQGGSTDPAETGRGELVLQGRLYGMDKPTAHRRAAEVLEFPSISWPQLTGRPARTRAGCAAGSTSGWASSTARRSSSSTSRRQVSTRRRAPACGTRSARLREGGTTVFLTTHYLKEADALADRLAIIDHGVIVAEGTGDELKRQVAGDVIALGVDGDHERVLALVRTEPFVREASVEDDLIRLYVDQGDSAVPQLIRLLDGADLQAM